MDPERRCCVRTVQGMLKPSTRSGSDRQGQVVERNGQPLADRHLDRQLVMAAAEVLHEPMAGNDDPGAVVLLESWHRSQPCLQAAVIGFEVVVGVLVGAVPCRWEQVFHDDRVGRSPIGDNLSRDDLGRADGPLEEPASRAGVAAS
jgi:hypothetical protein